MRLVREVRQHSSFRRAQQRESRYVTAEWALTFTWRGYTPLTQRPSLSPPPTPLHTRKTPFFGHNTCNNFTLWWKKNCTLLVPYRNTPISTALLESFYILLTANFKFFQKFSCPREFHCNLLFRLIDKTSGRFGIISLWIGVGRCIIHISAFKLINKPRRNSPL